MSILSETTWGSMIDPKYKLPKNFVLRDKKPDPPKYVCKACKKKCRFTEPVEEYCFLEDINMKAVRIAEKTKKGRL